MKISLVIPTLNAGERWKAFIHALAEQTLQPEKVLVIDSSSNDGTASLAKAAGYQVHQIEENNFSHGKTRQLAIDLLPESDVVIFMTQDALMDSPFSLERLVSYFKKNEFGLIGAVCGRQIPHFDATPIAAHSRLYNYGSCSRFFTKKDISLLGIKSTFMSDSFSAYNMAILCKVGGFDKNVIVCEDTLLAGKMLLAGYTTVYAADARVRHSHNFKLFEEAQRYFDIGVAHASQPWFISSFGEPDGEGFRYMKSECSYLLKNKLKLIPLAFIRNFLKYFFYRLGRKERYLPVKIKKYVSYQKYFWKNKK